MKAHFSYYFYLFLIFINPCLADLALIKDPVMGTVQKSHHLTSVSMAWLIKVTILISMETIMRLLNAMRMHLN